MIICPCRFLLQEHPSQQPGHCALQAQTQTVKANRKFPTEITLQKISSKPENFPSKVFHPGHSDQPGHPDLSCVPASIVC